MVCNKCYEITKNDNLLYGLRLTEINFINEEMKKYRHSNFILSVSLNAKINTGNAS